MYQFQRTIYAGGLWRISQPPPKRRRSQGFNGLSAGAISLGLVQVFQRWCSRVVTDWDSSHGGRGECPSLPHKERALQLCGQREGAEAERGGCYSGDTCFISIPSPRRRLYNSRRFQSGTSQICHAQTLAARQRCNKRGTGGWGTRWTWCSQRSKTLAEWKPPTPMITWT